MTWHQMTSQDQTRRSGGRGTAERTGRPTGRLRRAITVSAVTVIALATSVAAPLVTGTGAPSAGASTPLTVTQTFGFDNDTLQTFTVPANVTSLNLTMTGGQGGWGGTDSSGPPPAGGRCV